MNSFLRDVLFGIRMLLKSPGFTLVAILSLSVGIGVNSTVFGFVNAVLFKSIPVSNSEGLVYVFAGDRQKPYRPTSYVNYQEFRQQSDVFSGLAVFAAPPMLMTTGEHTEEINSEVVSANYFSVLDVRMQRGQPFAPVDDQTSFTEPSVVISDRFWHRRFNSEANIVGRQLILNGNSFSVVGIAPSTFTGTDPSISTDVWVPVTQWATIIENVNATASALQLSQGSANSKAPVGADTPNAKDTQTATQQDPRGRLGRDHNWLQMVGRLKPGVSSEHAEAVLTVIAARLKGPDEKNKEPLIATLSPASSVHPEISQELPTALFIIALTSLILMICCINVASLMLARAAARQKEFAIRIALGSSRRRLVRQLLTEALLLSIVGGIVGLILAQWTTRAVLGLIPPGDIGLSPGIAIDQRVLWFSFVISVLTALIFGLLPALNTFRLDVVHSLGAEAMSLGSGRSRIKLRRALVVIQIVTSMVLLVAGGLFLRSFQKGQVVSESFRSDRILLLNLSPRKYGYSVKYSKTFYRELLARIGAAPGVESVTLSSVVPLSIERSNVMARIEGGESKRFQTSTIAEGYFQTLNIPILRGREFDSSDDDSARNVAIINETMARTYWPGENPLGKLLHMGDRTPHEVVGVAKDTPYNNFGKASEPFLYLWLYQRPAQSISLIVRTSGEPATMIAPVQREVRALGGNLPIFDFKTLAEVTKSHMVAVKAAAALLGLLSLIGVLVASIGIYGVTSYSFSRRRREIGIRMSLGAQRGDILKLIMKEGITLSVIGIVIGLALTLGTTHFISSFLYGISPVDPVVFIGVATILGVVAVGASLVPSILAARSNPVDALRHE